MNCFNSEGCEDKDQSRCKNEGFIFKHPDCTCLCPPGLSGNTCDEIDETWTSVIDNETNKRTYEQTHQLYTMKQTNVCMNKHTSYRQRH